MVLNRLFFSKYQTAREIKFYLTTFLNLGILSASILLLSCSGKKPVTAKEELVARIGDRTITRNEFIERAEYTIRPAYCSGDNYIHKKIILNSLVAEKLLAIEAGRKNELTANKHFQRYIEGRQEQAMRQWLYNEVASKKAIVDTTQIKKLYRIAGRKYDISFVAMDDSRLADRVKSELSEKKTSLEAILASHGLAQKMTRRDVVFNGNEDIAVERALFDNPVQKGAVIGPLATEDEGTLLMQVNGWTNLPAITNAAIQQRWKDAADFLKEEKSRTLYDQYVAKLMHGKTINFVPQTFRRLVEIAGPLYLKSEAEKKEAFNRMYWGKGRGEVSIDTLGQSIAQIRDYPLFSIDGEVWKVADFESEMEKHPLVFRQQKIRRGDFAEQLKLAIVDLVRDKYITADAYKRGYEKETAVVRYRQMWEDNMLASFQCRKFLESVNCRETDHMKALSDYLNPYVKKLQQKYADRIEINTRQFEDIKITSIEMIALRKGDPFPIVVPSFPQITTLNRLDYGQAMN